MAKTEKTASKNNVEGMKTMLRLYAVFGLLIGIWTGFLLFFNVSAVMLYQILELILAVPTLILLYVIILKNKKTGIKFAGKIRNVNLLSFGVGIVIMAVLFVTSYPTAKNASIPVQSLGVLTYTNHGLKFTYPADWQIAEQDDESGMQLIVVMAAKSGTPVLTISMSKISESRTIDEVMTRYPLNTPLTTPYSDSTLVVLNSSKTEFKGISAYIMTLEHSPKESGLVTQEKLLSVVSNGRLYKFEGSPSLDDDSIKLILNSFEFAAPPSPTDLVTYNKAGLKFMFPADWQIIEFGDVQNWTVITASKDGAYAFGINRHPMTGTIEEYMADYPLNESITTDTNDTIVILNLSKTEFKGLPAYLVTAESHQSADGKVITVQKIEAIRNGILYILTAAPDLNDPIKRILDSFEFV